MGKRCGNCANGTWLKGKDAVPEVCLECKYVHAEPSNWKEKIMTNADRIRAMSDEEFVDFIGHNSLCDRVQDNANWWCQEHASCKGCLEEWLKQPVTEV